MTSKNSTNTLKTLILILCLFLSVGLIVVAYFLFNGKTTTSGSNPEDVKTSLLECSTENFSYPLLESINADSKSGKVTVIFGQNSIQTISLIASFYYGSEAEVTQGEASSHAAMNTSFSTDGLGPDALDATYAKLQDWMQMSLYANEDDLNEKTAKYFLLDTQDSVPQTITETKSIYEAQGFSCTVK